MLCNLKDTIVSISSTLGDNKGGSSTNFTDAKSEAGDLEVAQLV